MRGRVAAVTALAALLSAAGAARAHKLEAQCFVRPFFRVQVEAWYETEEPAAAARVQAFTAGGKLLAEGRTNEKGVFVFACGATGPVRVAVSAGGGHRKEVTVSADELERAGACSVVACLAPGVPAALAATTAPPAAQETAPGHDHSHDPPPLADRTPRTSVKDVLLGVGVVLAVAAFALSVRNARELRKLREGKSA